MWTGNGSAAPLTPTEPRAMLFRQLFEPQSSTYTYLLADPASILSRNSIET